MGGVWIQTCCSCPEAASWVTGTTRLGFPGERVGVEEIGKGARVPGGKVGVGARLSRALLRRAKNWSSVTMRADRWPRWGLKIKGGEMTRYD